MFILKTQAAPTGRPESERGTAILGGAQLIARLAVVVFVIALPVCLVTSNVRVLVSDVGFYRRGLREHGAALRTGIPLSELDRASLEIVDYFQNDAGTLRIVVTVEGEEEPLFNTREVVHMSDVKDLVQVLFVVQEASLVYVLAYVVAVFLWARERSLRALAWQTLSGIAVGLGAVAFVAVFAITGFDETWNRFHEIAFKNDLWRLDPDTDRLIQMFPEPFWQEATYLVGLATAGEALLLAAVGVAYLVFGARNRRPRPQERSAAVTS